MRIIDLHCDTLRKIRNQGGYLYSNNYHIDILKMKSANVSAQCFASFNNLKGEAAYKEFLCQKRLFDNLVKKEKKYITRSFEKEKTSAILTVENAELLNGKIGRLKVLKKAGVKIMGIIWNDENCLGYPNSENKEINELPLKEFGKQVIEKMSSLKIMPDVSHLNKGGFEEVIRISHMPVIASHSCCEKIYPHPRNLSDNQIRKIALSGGVVGINFYSRFINGSGKTLIKDIVKQAKHIENIGGIETVAFGSDFDGIECQLEFNDCAGYPLIVDELLENFSFSETEKICYKNAERLFFA